MGAAPLLHRVWGSLGVVLPPRRCNGPPAWSWSCPALPGLQVLPASGPSSHPPKSCVAGWGQEGARGDLRPRFFRILCSVVLKVYLLLRLCSQAPLVFAASLTSSISPPRRTSVGYSLVFNLCLLAHLFLCCAGSSLLPEGGPLVAESGGWPLITEHGGLRGPWACGLSLDQGRSGCLGTGRWALTCWAPGTPSLA